MLGHRCSDIDDCCRAGRDPSEPGMHDMADHTLTDSDFSCAVRNHRCEFDAITHLARRGGGRSSESAIRVPKGQTGCPTDYIANDAGFRARPRAPGGPVDRADRGEPPGCLFDPCDGHIASTTSTTGSTATMSTTTMTTATLDVPGAMLYYQVR